MSVIESPRHYRAVKARAVRYRDHDAAAAADLGARAAKIAKAIRVGCAGPPFPAAVIEELRNLLPPVSAKAGQ